MKEVAPQSLLLIMVVKRKRVSRLIPKKPAHPKVSHSRSSVKGTRGYTPKNLFLVRLGRRSAKTD
ncbi:hypothetical protein DKE52_012215 [Acinetobacter pittii]|uniref:Uncharacterized protein n=1 Tax=Acinetobacter pittii TaxID=48296 RepID=A0A3G6YJY2_ACIPI|nr:hypothetical protein DKE52_012215 [Acinetobacter pittii]